MLKIIKIQLQVTVAYLPVNCLFPDIDFSSLPAIEIIPGFSPRICREANIAQHSVWNIVSATSRSGFEPGRCIPRPGFLIPDSYSTGIACSV
jgi:hypothetical protein